MLVGQRHQRCREPHRVEILELLGAERGSLFIPAPVTAEIDYNPSPSYRRGEPNGRRRRRRCGRLRPPPSARRRPRMFEC